MNPIRYVFVRSLLVIGISLFSSLAFAAAAVAETRGIGVNKVDLAAQYLGLASGGRGTAHNRAVTVAMARKAMQDARDIGVPYMRVAMTYFTGDCGARSDARLWQENPQRYWAMIDEMMADLDAHGIQIIPSIAFGLRAFPCLAGETARDMMVNPGSRSWQLLERYTAELVQRYRGRKTVLFYELGNEWNNLADIDLEAACRKPDKEAACEKGRSIQNITSDELMGFIGRFAGVIRKADPSRAISPGLSIPRPAAAHLRRSPAISGKADWTPDSVAEFGQVIADMHRSVDIVSAHIYIGEGNKRFGRDEIELLREVKRVADRLGKPLFLGEFGDWRDMSGNPGSGTARMLRAIVDLRVQYSAIWAWQFYQNTPFRPEPRYNIEPGYTDGLIARLREANAAMGSAVRTAGGPDKTPPRVVLTWPLGCTQIGKAQPVHAVASDESGRVDRVEFWLGDTKVLSDNQPPYEATLDVTDTPPGEYRLSARAYDAAGNVAQFESTVLVKKPPASSRACAVQ